MVTVMSLPITVKAIWLTTSGITGLTLPGMIDDPACIAGKLISPKPARGPDESNLKSLAVLDNFTATRLRTPLTKTKTPLSWVASTMSSATTNCQPANSLR